MQCITLLSDFGLQDASVAAAKGVLMSQLPDAELIDISHQVEPFHLQQAAYLIRTAYSNFPKGTCHILLFDIFSDKQPRLLACEKEGHYFLAPDNGVLSLAFGTEFTNAWSCYELQAPDVFKNWLEQCAAKCTAIFSGEFLSSLPAECAIKVAPKQWQPVLQPDGADCHVIHIDRFENVVVNFTRNMYEEIGKGRNIRISYMRNDEINELSTYYFNVPEGGVLCRFNNAGFLEIAINRGKAASLLGLRLTAGQHIYNTIKIRFE